jgi:hypothetical protein
MFYSCKEPGSIPRAVLRLPHSRPPRPHRVTGDDTSADRGSATDDVVISHGERVMTRIRSKDTYGNERTNRDTEH